MGRACHGRPTKLRPPRNIKAVAIDLTTAGWDVKTVTAAAMMTCACDQTNKARAEPNAVSE